jgi:hypothetical protein
MAEHFTSRRRGGPEGLTIFASSRRQTLGSVFALVTPPCEQTSSQLQGARQIDYRADLEWAMGNRRKTKKQIGVCNPFVFLCTCREARLIGFKFVEVVPLKNIFMLRRHRMQIEIGDVRFHHVGQEQVREK